MYDMNDLFNSRDVVGCKLNQIIGSHKYKNRPDLLLRKPGRFICVMVFYSRFSSARTITCGDF